MSEYNPTIKINDSMIFDSIGYDAIVSNLVIKLTSGRVINVEIQVKEYKELFDSDNIEKSIVEIMNANKSSIGLPGDLILD